MSTTHVSQSVNAPRELVYRALIDPLLIQKWRVPDGMSCHVHEFDAREGGYFRVSLTYDLPTDAGKTNSQTDTYHGRFLKLVPNEQIVEEVEFETQDPSMQGKMKITTSLKDVDGGTEVLGIHEGLPPGLSPADNEIGWRMSLEKLASLLGPGSHS